MQIRVFSCPPCEEHEHIFLNQAVRLLTFVLLNLILLGNAAVDLLTDRTKLLTAVGGVTGLFLGIFGAREATRVAGRTIDRWLGTPRLVRRSSSRFLM